MNSVYDLTDQLALACNVAP